MINEESQFRWDRPEDLPPPPATLDWLEADSNPFGIRMLDIRSVTWNVVSSTSDQAIVTRFLSTRGSSGEEFVGRHANHGREIPCSLSYPFVPDFSEGPLFVARVMEDKWDVFIQELLIRVARSWTGELRFIGRIRPHEASDRLMIIDQVEAATDDGALDHVQAIHDFDFVMKAYVLGRVVPNTVPLTFRAKAKEAMALYSYSVHGRRATFATFEDVRSTPMKPTWYKIHTLDRVFVILAGIHGAFPFLWNPVKRQWLGAAAAAGPYLYRGEPGADLVTEAEVAEVLERQGTTLAASKVWLYDMLVKMENAAIAGERASRG
jgi:hypothetical protein